MKKQASKVVSRSNITALCDRLRKKRKKIVFTNGVFDILHMGHVSYLMFYNIWMAVMLIASVAVCDLIAQALRRRSCAVWKNVPMQSVFPIPLTVGVALLLMRWSTIPDGHAAIIGAMIPILVMMGRRTGDFVEADLGVEVDALTPGRGQILDNLKSLLFTAPVVFHYIRYFLT